MRTFIIALFTFFSMSAYSAPLTWVIEDAVFDDSTTMTGQFDYDAATNTYSNISIQTYAYDLPWGNGEFSGTVDVTPEYDGLWQAPTTFCPDAGQSSTCLYLNLFYGNGYDTEFGLLFSSALTGAGGNINFLSSTHEIFYEVCSGCQGFSRNLVAGQVSAVPVPAAIWLFGSALAGLGWLRKKQAV